MIDLDEEIELLRQREWKLRAEQQTVLDHKDALLREALRAIDKAFDYEGDVFGRMHNNVVDLVADIKTELGEI